MPTYKDSGVDFNTISRFRNALVDELKFSGEGHKRAIKIGHYAGLVSFMGGYLALHTDGVGTKTIMAKEFNYFDEIGYDLVGMNVNDIISIGAEPIAMVDYIASSDFDENQGRMIGKSINAACAEAGIPVVGGETASVPDLIRGIDISGTAVGFVKEGEEIDGREIIAGDRIIGLPSKGFHSNGFSLIRKIYENKRNRLEDEINGTPLWRLLLKGTTIYSKRIFGILEETEIHGMAHITGGGFRNIPRLGQKLFEIKIPNIPEIFRVVTEEGSIPPKEAFETFNMGIGFVIISPKSEVDNIFDSLKILNPVELGVVKEGNGVSIENYGIKYSGYY